MRFLAVITIILLTCGPLVALAKKKRKRQAKDGPPPARNKRSSGPNSADVCEITDPEGRRFYGSMPVIADVPRMAWDLGDPRFRDKIVAQGTPVVLYNTPVSYNWPALGAGNGKRKWSTDFLVQELGAKASVPVFYAKSGVYLYSSTAKSSKIAEKYSGEKGVSAYKTTSPMKYVPLHQFVRAAKKAGKLEEKRQQTGQEVMGGPVSRMYYNLLVDRTSPFYPILSDIDFQNSRQLFGLSRESPPTTHIWWGPPGVRSAPHYDMSQNFYVQIFGEKTFYLASPSDNQKWRMFPERHPASRHTMHPWPINAKDNVDAGSLIAANLSPGDILYIPSLWVHAAMTVGTEMSFSISWWSNPVRERDILTAAIENCDSLAPGAPQAQAALDAVMGLLTELHGGDSAAAKTALLGEVPRFLTSPQLPPPCTNDPSPAAVAALQQLQYPAPSSGATPPPALTLAAVRNNFRLAISNLDLRGGTLSTYGGETRMGLVYTEGLVLGAIGEKLSCAFYEALPRALSA